MSLVTCQCERRAGATTARIASLRWRPWIRAGMDAPPILSRSPKITRNGHTTFAEWSGRLLGWACQCEAKGGGGHLCAGDPLRVRSGSSPVRDAVEEVPLVAGHAQGDLHAL